MPQSADLDPALDLTEELPIPVLDLTEELPIPVLDLTEELPIRIRVCLQAYRNSMKNGPGFSR